MCFEASTMAACNARLQSSSSFSTDALQFLISPRETKSILLENKEPSSDLVDYNSLPEFLKHNEFIINYYRSEWPLKKTIFSIFSIHNETLNIWTHLIGFFIFLILTGYAASIFPSESSSHTTLHFNSSNSSNTFPAFQDLFVTADLQTPQLLSTDEDDSLLQPWSPPLIKQFFWVLKAGREACSRELVHVSSLTVCKSR